MNRQAVITVSNLTAGFGTKNILENVTFEVYEGEIFVVLGPSGCGKTTLLKQMIGLHTPSAGRIVIDGQELTGCDDQTYQLILRKIGVLYQGGALFGSMTLAENVLLPIREYTTLSRTNAERLALMKLELVNLREAAHMYPSEISGGMRKRAAIARSLALNPKIIFFDELSAGLDPVTAAELDSLILTLNSVLGTTMVVVSHELMSIYRTAHRAIMLDSEAQGIIAEGDPCVLRDTSTDPRVKQFFNPQMENG